MDRLSRDLRIALRGLRRAPAFTISAVLILGLAIGMSSAMATIFNAVLLRRLPVQQQDRLAVLWTERDPGVELALDPRDDLTLLRQYSRTMSGVAGYAHWGAFAFPLADGDEPLVIPQARVTGNFFDVLGARPVLGRLLRPEDDVDGAPRVMVLSYDVWQRQFHGDSSVIGRQLRLPSLEWRATIVGVAPAGLDFPVGTGYWGPIRAFGPAVVDLVARLAPNATTEAAATELLSLMRNVHPDYGLKRGVAKSFSQAVVGDVRPVLVVLTSAVALLLLIACVNVGNLLLLRASGRSRELTIRRSLGASSSDLARQLLVESLVLASFGGILGVFGASALLRLLLTFAPTQLPRLDVIRLEGAPIGVAAGVSVFAVLCFGVLPSLFAARGSEVLATALRSDARSGESATRRRARQWLVASQLALALVTLSGAGLLVRSLERLEHIDLGYRADHLVLVEMSFPFSRYDTAPKYMALFDRVYARMREVAGVSALSPVLIPPFLGPNVWQWKYEVEGQTKAEADATPLVPVEAGGEEYFKTFGIPILRGRGFAITDRDSAPKVAIVSEAIAQRMWPGRDPVGKRIRFTGIDSAEWRTVVGVAGDIRFRSLRDATPTIYLPWRQSVNQAYFAVRTNLSPATLLPLLRRAAREVDPGMGFWRARTMDELLSTPLAQPRLSTVLLAGFSVVALLLAAIGLYGVMSSSVREQTRELGIRMALGASPERLRRAVLVGALRVTLAGASAGLMAAIVSSRLLSSLLYDVSPTDPFTLGAVCLILVGVALAAALLPAHRVTRIDPVSALRVD